MNASDYLRAHEARMDMTRVDQSTCPKCGEHQYRARELGGCAKCRGKVVAEEVAPHKPYVLTGRAVLDTTAIRALFEATGMTRRSIARLSGIHYEKVRKWTHVGPRQASVEEVAMLAEVFGVSPDSLIVAMNPARPTTCPDCGAPMSARAEPGTRCQPCGTKHYWDTRMAAVVHNN